MTAVLKPVGQRPRCQACGKELRPNFKRPRPPIWHSNPDGTTGDPLTRKEKTAWRAQNPAVFEGTYGAYRDNRFCGLNCGYIWAVRRAKEGL